MKMTMLLFVKWADFLVHEKPLKVLKTKCLYQIISLRLNFKTYEIISNIEIFNGWLAKFMVVKKLEVENSSETIWASVQVLRNSLFRFYKVLSSEKFGDQPVGQEKIRGRHTFLHLPYEFQGSLWSSQTRSKGRGEIIYE